MTEVRGKELVKSDEGDYSMAAIELLQRFKAGAVVVMVIKPGDNGFAFAGDSGIARDLPELLRGVIRRMERRTQQ